MRNVAIFASGSGTNFQAIIDYQMNHRTHYEIKLLVCDRPGAAVIERAQMHQIPIFVFSPKDYPNKTAFETVILQQLQEHNIDWIVLAGYMRLIGDTLLAEYEGRMINIHPSLLPAFPGKESVRDAYLYGVKVTGVTIHFVDDGLDSGPIIAQEAISTSELASLDAWFKEIHRLEHRLLPRILDQLVKNDEERNEDFSIDEVKK